jgi:hypothetical protein
MLAMPEAGGRPVAGDKLQHLPGLDLGEMSALLTATE